MLYIYILYIYIYKTCVYVFVNVCVCIDLHMHCCMLLHVLCSSESIKQSDWNYRVNKVAKGVVTRASFNIESGGEMSPPVTKFAPPVTGH